VATDRFRKVKDSMNVKALLEHELIGQSIDATKLFTSSRYTYLKKPPVIKSCELRGYVDDTVSIRIEFHPDENGQAIAPYHADIDEEIPIL
jgi:hypothetical protein